MSRGGRRRRSKRSNRPAGSPASPGSRAQPGSRTQPGPQGEEEPEKQPAGRVRREPGGRQRSALESMRTLPTRVQTLPPDGLILEELISNMQTEYGTPTTPQEYRLIVKLPTHEEAPAAPAADPVAEVEDGEVEAEPRPPRSSRRRRRGRRRSGAASEDETDDSPEAHGLSEGDDEEFPGDDSGGEGVEELASEN
jgi:hypothetical protein